MDFSLTREQEMVRRMASEFAEKFCEPEAAAIDESHEFPMETWKKMQQYGLLRINHAREYGGTGLDPVAEMIVIEELSKASLTHGAIYALLGNGFPTFVELFGTKEQKEKYVTAVLEQGDIGSFEMTEPDAGSDAGGVHTTSTKDGDDYIINGAKCFITAGNIAKYHLVVCQADAKAGERGFNGFIVESGTPGLTIGKIENKMGIRALPTAEVIYEDVRVSKEQMLGGPGAVGKMMKFALGTLDAARIGTGAQALGVATAAFEKALSYSGERVQFGKPINANQGIKWYLAEMAGKLDMARLLIYRAAWLESQGKPFSKEAAMAKLYATGFGREIVNDALQIHGGYGYVHDYPLERMYRDIKITEIYEGSSEIMKVVIANNLIPRAPKKKDKKAK
ncbi:acyl-CoA dehydrogenase family protein [Clostridium sp. AN503]|uniref:acyl-CoA dehydrogenase family protein n=1 Tax=Clostridium sp. AN503 TaxID=3160598 RepID=UPI0034597A9A